MIVCEKAPGAADILHVSLDLAIRGNEVQFARPLFNPRGTRVFGSELGSGSVDAGGKVQMTSTWEVRSVVSRGEYSGTLTPSGGVLSGTQSWHGSEDEARTRSCHICTRARGAFSASGDEAISSAATRMSAWLISDIRRSSSDVRFTPNSGHVRCTSSSPLCANNGHRAIYSITSSAR